MARVLVVFCHPVPESFNTAVLAAALRGLAAGGHETRVIDLYKDGFDPVLSADERRTYNTGDIDHCPTAHYANAILWANELVFIYPTWWYNLPAMLKGFLDRVFLPDVAFFLPDPNHQGIHSNMRSVTRVTAITTCGATWLLSKYVGEPGRKTLLRGVRTLCSLLCRTRYLALYKMDSVTEQKRAAYLAKVEHELAK